MPPKGISGQGAAGRLIHSMPVCTPSLIACAVFSELDTICRSSESAKKRVQDKVKSLVCKFGGKGQGKLELKGGVITFILDWDLQSEFIPTQLKKQL